MSWIYVTEPGAKLSKQGGHYIIRRENETLCEVPICVVEGVTLFDTIQISADAIVELLKNKVPVTWLSSTGRFFGRLESTDNSNVLRQKEQFAALENEEFRLKLAKRVAFGKIYNQRTILRNYNRRINSPSVEKARWDIRVIADKIHQIHGIDQLRGYEGMIAKIYFHGIGQMVPKSFAFEKRTRRPPKDYFNSMLSLGYTLLLYDFYNALINCGLHPYVGFFHALKNGHPALASDLMDPWRPAVVDGLCLSLVKRKEISPEHFDISETGGVYLNRIGRKIFIEAYEKKIRSVNTYFQGKYSWRHTIQMECDSYSLAVHQMDVEQLKPMVIR